MIILDDLKLYGVATITIAAAAAVIDVVVTVITAVTIINVTVTVATIIIIVTVSMFVIVMPGKFLCNLAYRATEQRLISCCWASTAASMSQMASTPWPEATASCLSSSCMSMKAAGTRPWLAMT